MSETDQLFLWGVFLGFLAGIFIDQLCSYLVKQRRLNTLLYPYREKGDEPCWESIPAVQDGEVVGYQVRWSEPDTEGRFLWASHYYAGRGPSIDWCESAAQRDAIRRNESGTRPEGLISGIKLKRGTY